MKPKAKTIRLNGDMRVNLLDNLFNKLFTQRVAALVKESRDYAMRTYHSHLGSGEWTMLSTLAKRGLIPTGASITASIHKPNSQNKFETMSVSFLTEEYKFIAGLDGETVKSMRPEYIRHRYYLHSTTYIQLDVPRISQSHIIVPPALAKEGLDLTKRVEQVIADVNETIKLVRIVAALTTVQQLKESFPMGYECLDPGFLDPVKQMAVVPHTGELNSLVALLNRKAKAASTDTAQ